MKTPFTDSHIIKADFLGFEVEMVKAEICREQELKAQVAERNDARYRWLRDSGCMDNVPAVFADDDCNTWLQGNEMDEAIDAAMAMYPLSK